MQTITELMRTRANQLLADHTVDRVLGWKVDELSNDCSPTVFGQENIDNITYNLFSAANLSKFLIEETKKGKTLVFLKACDSYSFHRMLSEHRFDRSKVYAIGIECHGMLDKEKVALNGIYGIKSAAAQDEEIHFDTTRGEAVCAAAELLCDKCMACKPAVNEDFDEVLGDDVVPIISMDRFEEVKELEAKSSDERFAFWQNELSRCIRCNACREICPACTCIECVFDNNDSVLKSKVSSDDSEDSLFHITRAFHVAGRCTDCGECSRVCPQDIPLHLLNRKMIMDINDLYGEHQAGVDEENKSPLTTYTLDDAEPSIVKRSGGV